MPERKHPLALCEECSLKDETYVPTDGPANAKIAVVAEAPGFEEERQEKPLVGPSGQVINAVLKEHGLLRKNLLVTNSVSCRPPENRDPSKLELACCRPRLLDDLKNAETIITLGNFGLKAVYPTKEGIMKVRVGPPRAIELEGRTVNLIATVHPAYVLRSPDQFPTLVTDIGKVHYEVGKEWTEPKYKVYDNPAAAASALQQLQNNYPEYVLDIETGLEKDEQFAHANEIICCGFSYAPNKAIVITDTVLDHWASRGLMKSALGPSNKLGAHNGKFDLPGLVPTLDGFLPKLSEDTLLSSYAQDERPGIHALKFRGRETLGYPNWDIEIQNMAERDSPEAREKIYKYNAIDCCATYDLMHHDRKHMDDRAKKVYRHLIEVSNALMPMEIAGIALDYDYLCHLGGPDDDYEEYSESDFNVDLLERCGSIGKELARMERQLSQWVENPRSPIQIKAAMKRIGWPVKDTAEATLVHLMGLSIVPNECKELAKRILAYRKDFKTFSTYVGGMRKRATNGRIYPTYLLHGTVTGRLSCRNPNLQNLTRGSVVRDLFVPGEGNVFVAADFKAIELRVEACLAHDEHLRELFNSGADVHAVFAKDVYGPDFTDEQRSICKTFVYAGAYGEEPASTGSRLNLAPRVASAIHSKLNGFMPAVRTYQAQTKRRVLSGEDLVTPFGRTRHNYLITDKNMKDIVKESWAFEPQSIANDINLNALIQLEKDGIQLRTTTHDSDMAECKASEAKEVGEHMREVMERTARECYSDYVEFPVDIKIGRSWGSC